MKAKWKVSKKLKSRQRAGDILYTNIGIRGIVLQKPSKALYVLFLHDFWIIQFRYNHSALSETVQVQYISHNAWHLFSTGRQLSIGEKIIRSDLKTRPIFTHTYDWTSVTSHQAHTQPPITVFFASLPQQPPENHELYATWLECGISLFVSRSEWSYTESEALLSSTE